MKRLALCGLFAFFLLACFFIIGCSQSGVSTTTTTTTTTTLPIISSITSYLGVSLGWTTNEVISVLGSPSSTSINGLFQKYSYGPYFLVRNVYFTLSDNKMVAINSEGGTPTPESIKGVVFGLSTLEVKALLGPYETTTSGTSYYDWNYPSYHIWVQFDYSTNRVYLFGMYDPTRISFTPN